MPKIRADAEQKQSKLNENMFDNTLIYHCSGFSVNGSGGAETYLTSLINYQLPGVSDRVIKSLYGVEQSQFKLLHLHSPDLLFGLTGKCPTIFTVHNHSAYCPSGTKYLPSRNGVCDRNFSYLGCSWGKIIDGCGSRRPQKAIQEFQHSRQVLDILKNLKVTIIANSDFVRRQLINNGLPAEQIITLHCGTTIPQTITAPLSLEIHQNQRILFVGRIVPDKGLEWLLKTLVHTNPQIKLDIAGEGWDRPRLEKLANKLGLNDRITWHGWCNKEQLNTLYQQCFAVVFPSIWPEPAGLVTLEAYARYRPVIASAVGGIPEHLRDNETGILVPANNVNKLAQVINELSTDYEKCRSIGKQGHAFFIKEYTIDAHVKHLQKIYQKVIAEFSNS